MNTMITIVSGLPRSGTSMMMRMLEAGGMVLVIDNIRKADEDNPYGYFEFEKVKKIKKDSSWLDYTQGKAFKIVSMLLYNLPHDKNYKVIFMKRNMKEIMASQKIMLERHKRDRDDVDDEQMARLSEKHIHQIDIWLGKQQNIDTLYVNYNDFIERPRENAEAVNQYLGNILDVDRMVKTVDKSLYRNRFNSK
jgi:RNase adaptor protein for sRNA GlmZ degradation